MSVDFISRDAWRNRGRPRTPADPQVVATLRGTYNTGKVARITLDDTTTAEDVKATITQLTRAAEQLGLHLRLQPRRSKEILAAREMRFFVEDQ